MIWIWVYGKWRKRRKNYKFLRGAAFISASVVQFVI